jgi:UDP:flavonoid glycosyltransferase YjiC (YdhE family)
MAKLLVGSTPLLGHVAPLVPIVAELVDRGHEVAWYTGERWQKRVESTGAHFLPMRFAEDLSLRPVNERFPERGRQTGINSLLFDIRHIFAAPTVGYVLDLQEYLRRFPADVILSDAAFLAGGWVHELDGPPWAVLNPFNINLSGRNFPPFGLGSPPASTFAGRLRVYCQQVIGRRFLYANTTGYVDRLRDRAGLEATDQIFWDRALSPFLYMQGSVSGLEYPRDDLPPQFHFIGPLISHSSPAPFEPPAWWGEISSTLPVVLVTQGTLSNNPQQLLIPALQGLSSEHVQIVATTGGFPVDKLPENSVPENARIEQFIPFDRLLPYVNLMVTNGGYNGVQMALSRGVPLVVAGATEDKLEVNARVAWTGTGIDLRTMRPSPVAIRNAVRTVLSDLQFRKRAARIALEFQQHNGAITGADLVEQLMATGKPVISHHS